MGSMMEVEVATKKLALLHYANDPDTKQIFSLPNPERIQLIEVTDSVGTTGEICPIEFGPDVKNLILFPSEIILVSPAEWGMIRDQKLNLPESWDMESLELIPRAS